AATLAPVAPAEDLAAAAEVIRAEPVAATGGVVLEMEGLGMAFGGVTALENVSIQVREREIFGLIGPNGAGKTTLFNCVTGVFHPMAGEVCLGDEAVTDRRPHEVTRAGIARTFQNIRLFPNMTARENVMVGVDARHNTSVPGALLGLP